MPDDVTSINKRIEDLEQAKQAEGPGGDILITVVTHGTKIDPLTGERSEVVLPVTGYTEPTEGFELADGSRVRVRYAQHAPDDEPGEVVSWPKIQ